jgi:lipopolysaccharide/colanic/teichoic acid biosynthesis glycosyltransferase
MITRALDILISLLALFLLVLLLPFIALLIKLDSKGPVFYKCNRVGLGGRVFKMYKFRTMYETSGPLGPSLSPHGDPRVTTLGRILRRLKFNEFPQFFNVLLGDMTLIGPRPEAPDLAAAYPEEAKKVFTVKPGLAGPNQILGRNEEELFPLGVDPVAYYISDILPNKLAIDLKYIEDKTPFKDLKYLVLAVKAVVGGAIGRQHLLNNRGQLLLLTCDIILCLLSFTLAHHLRYDDISNPILRQITSQTFYKILPWTVLARLPIFIFFGFYYTIIRHLSFYDIKRVIQGVALASLVLASVAFLLGYVWGKPFHGGGYSRGVFLTDWFCLTTLLVGYRALAKKIYWRSKNGRVPSEDIKRVLIWGAGDAGELCLTFLQKEQNPTFQVVGFIDDDPQKQGKRLRGVRILGNRHHLGILCQLYQVQVVFVAIPSASSQELMNILALCREFGLEVELFLVKPHFYAQLMSEQEQYSSDHGFPSPRARICL